MIPIIALTLSLSRSPYCLPYNSYDVSLENLIQEQLIIPLMIFFFILVTWLLDILLLLKGEMLSWVLLGVRGLRIPGHKTNFGWSKVNWSKTRKNTQCKMYTYMYARCPYTEKGLFLQKSKYKVCTKSYTLKSFSLLFYPQSKKKFQSEPLLSLL